MNDSDQRLIDRYLDGTLQAEDAAQLVRRLDEDPNLLDALAMEAFDLGSLRDALSADAINNQEPIPYPYEKRRRTAMPVLAAAAVVVALVGWTAAWWTHSSLKQADREITGLRGQVSELIADAHEGPDPLSDHAPKLQTISSRGLLLTLDDQGKPLGRLVSGSVPPLGQRLWTCPWGAADLRFSDGLSVAMDRSTVATLEEEQGAHVVRLESGLLYVTRWPPQSDSPTTVVQTPHARIRLTNAQIAVDVRNNRTIVEAAEGIATVAPLTPSDGESVTVKAQHYVVIEPGQDAVVTPGRLTWSLHPLSSR
jgi:ferric-dicitrate binding protein FerR (iron transport regulator)